MTKEAKPDRRFKKVKRGATLRVEIHISNFCADTMALTCADMGHLQMMLMCEAAREHIPPAPNDSVQRAFDRRADYSRIKGGFSGGASLSLEKRRAVYERDGGVCCYCRQAVSWADYHCDHVEPRKAGGSDHMDNLAASCRPCNLSKAAKALSEWCR